jgi:hypothetical protein
MLIPSFGEKREEKFLNLCISETALYKKPLQQANRWTDKIFQFIFVTADLQYHTSSLDWVIVAYNAGWPNKLHFWVNPANRGSQENSPRDMLLVPTLLKDGQNLGIFWTIYCWKCYKSINTMQPPKTNTLPIMHVQLNFLPFPFCSYIALTNQTTYEVARRKRIFYLRYVILGAIQVLLCYD